MKYIKYLPAFFAIALYSCIDTEEKIVLNADNSGTYSMVIDLGRMLKVAGSMGDGNAASGKIKEKKDTTVYLKNIVNLAGNLTDAEKALYKDGVVHVNLDEEKDEMKIAVTAPFKNTADLTEMKNNFPAVLNKLKALDKITGEKPPSEEEENMKLDNQSANPVGDQFTFLAGPGKISNTVTNLEAFKKKVATDSTLGMITQMTGMMGDFNYRTIIKLPNAVKKYEGPGSDISVDKKTITFSTTLSEMIEHPEKVSYKIEF